MSVANFGAVVSVNVGAVRTINYRGRAITTAIFKEPVETKIRIAGVNFAGDDQADRRNHGGPTRSAYAYAEEDYAWWRKELGRKLSAGLFGENLTLGNVDVNGALIGEQWRVGDALLQVTAPRVPCFKLGMKMGDETFVRRFAHALRPGAYLSVIEPGEVQRGDPVRIVSKPHHGMSIKDVATIYFLEPERGAELLAVNPLPENWREWAQRQTA